MLNYNLEAEHYFYNASGIRTYDENNLYINQQINTNSLNKLVFSSSSQYGASSIRICEFNNENRFISRKLIGTTSGVIDLNSQTNYIIVSINKSNDLYYVNPQLEKGSISTNYVEHKEQTLPLTLGNIELCKIGDYQDYFYKESNKWYLHKEIEKVVLDGTQTGLRAPATEGYRFCIDLNGKVITSNVSEVAKLYSNKFKGISRENSYSNIQGIAFSDAAKNYKDLIIYCEDTKNMTFAEFQTWLSNNNTEVYYPLITPTDTEITDTTLISQLEAINNAISYEEQTNISSNTIALFNVEAYQDAKVILAEKGTYSKPSTGIPKTDLASAVQTSLNKADSAIQEHQDISGKQDKTDNNLTTINKTIVGAINEVDSIAKGANQALSYGNYSTMITAFNNLANDIYNIGQNIMIITLEVPDLWISSIESTSSTYTYVDDETFVNELKTNGYVQVGYYKLSALETQKVNLDDYVTKTENKNKADIINNELTGSTIYFTDGINNSPVNKLIVNIEPVQEGSGTPTPNNVRNIIGWNAAIINYSGADTQNPNVLNVSWQNEAGIVYGGILNVTTGLLTVTKALVELSVEDMNNTETYPGWKNTGIESIIGVGINQKFTSILNIGDTFSANTTSGTGTIFLPRSAYGLTQEQWKEQYPNLTIQIIAEYQNPETYQLTPHEIRTLLGINNFWANTGDVTVNYKADTKLYIDSKFQSLEDRLSLVEG